MQVVVGVELRLNGLLQFAGSADRGVSGVPVPDGLYSGILDEIGCFEIKLAFAEIDDRFPRSDIARIRSATTAVGDSRKLRMRGASEGCNVMISPVPFREYCIFCINKCNRRQPTKLWPSASVLSEMESSHPQIDQRLLLTEEARKRWVEENCPAGYIGDPADVAALVTFLASPRALYHRAGHLRRRLGQTIPAPKPPPVALSVSPRRPGRAIIFVSFSSTA